MLIFQYIPKKKKKVQTNNISIAISESSLQCRNVVKQVVNKTDILRTGVAEWFDNNGTLIYNTTLSINQTLGSSEITVYSNLPETEWSKQFDREVSL